MVNLNTKICNTCRNIKPLFSYGKDSRNKSGLRGQCKECENLSKRNSRLNNPSPFRDSSRRCYIKNRHKRVEYHIKNRVRLILNMSIYQDRNYKSWIGIIPKVTECQVCSNPIIFNSGDLRTSIHFDHRHEGIESIKSPSNWLSSHSLTPENKLIWESCNFGMLCKKCNDRLPTKDRRIFLLNALRYSEESKDA